MKRRFKVALLGLMLGIIAGAGSLLSSTPMAAEAQPAACSNTSCVEGQNNCSFVRNWTCTLDKDSGLCSEITNCETVIEP